MVLKAGNGHNLVKQSPREPILVDNVNNLFALTTKHYDEILNNIY
jgi:hypothetical protein